MTLKENNTENIKVVDLFSWFMAALHQKLSVQKYH